MILEIHASQIIPNYSPSVVCHERKRIHCKSSLEFNGCKKSSFWGGGLITYLKTCKTLVQKTLNTKNFRVFKPWKTQNLDTHTHTHTLIYIDCTFNGILFGPTCDVVFAFPSFPIGEEHTRFPYLGGYLIITTCKIGGPHTRFHTKLTAHIQWDMQELHF
jgi:hypothetical protein